ncbi:unnamed protein product [Schistosoma margrebowiei]|uniref:Uncharacterized protein n=1 Tax=Schistosoma margrebowiei TaxID=48269 RepID=A0A183M567_9TREM|nr:unnamed protein product [Schistosoma margrebowiei]
MNLNYEVKFELGPQLQFVDLLNVFAVLDILLLIVSR